MNLLKLMEALAPYAGEDVKVYNLNTEEGLKGFNEQLDILENIGLETLEAFGINGKEWIAKMREIGKEVYEANKAKEQNKENKAKRIVKQAVKQMERKEEDHSEEDEDEPKQEFKRPSELLNVNQKLQLHKIVQEYVDTMIKPFNKNVLTTQQINDAYAGLYEFAAWVMNK